MRRQREEEGVAVRRGPCGDVSTDRTSSTAAIVDDDRLAKLFGKRILQYARDDVGAASRRIRHYEGNGFSRPLRRSGRCGQRERKAGQECAKRHACVPALLSGQRAFYGTLVQELAVLVHDREIHET